FTAGGPPSATAYRLPLTAYCLLLTAFTRYDCRNKKIEWEMSMKLTEFLRAERDREVERSRRALEQAPEGKHDWKPHEKSMIFGYLANMVATIPTWGAMQINQDELDVAPAGGGQMKQERLDGSEDLLNALDKA